MEAVERIEIQYFKTNFRKRSSNSWAKIGICSIGGADFEQLFWEKEMNAEFTGFHQ
jgi:hypothetical protein